MTKNKIVLFDIDYTLFDTAIFREKLYKAISKALHINEDRLSVSQKEAMEEVIKESGYFNHAEFSRLLARKLKREKDELLIRDAIFERANFKNNYYTEIISVLEALSGVAKVGIFSKGFSDFQEEKLRDIKHLLDQEHIHITLDKYTTLPSIINKYKDKTLYLVDDALDVLYTAWKLRRDIKTIWVKRGRYAICQKDILGFTPSFTVDDLIKVPIIIKGDK